MEGEEEILFKGLDVIEIKTYFAVLNNNNYYLLEEKKDIENNK